MPRGGAREGSGRKPVEDPRKRLVIYVTAAERRAIQSFLAEMRYEPTDSPGLDEFGFAVDVPVKKPSKPKLSDFNHLIDGDSTEV